MKRSRVILIVAIVASLAVVLALTSYIITQQQASASCSRSATTLVTMFGKISLPTGSVGSNLTLTVTNTTCSPITGITVVSVQPQIAGVANSSFVEFNGNLVTPSSPLPAGQLGTGSIAVSGIASGQEYILTVKVDFAPGTAAQTETMVMYPES